jgi:putative restriction endonuclease
MGISLEPAELTEYPLPMRTRGRRRDPAFRELALVAYEYRCPLCGYDGQLQREAVGIDAAHWWAAEEPDEVANGVAACSFHHKLLDRGAIDLTGDRKLAVSTHFIGRSPMADTLVLSLIDRAPSFAPVRSAASAHRPHRLAELRGFPGARPPRRAIARA